LRPAVADSRLLDLQLAHGGHELALGQAAIADHLAAALLIFEMLPLLDPLGDLRLDRLSQEPLGSLAKNLVQGMPRLWQADCRCISFVHGGVPVGEKDDL
jgi:hypothetical protein